MLPILINESCTHKCCVLMNLSYFKMFVYARYLFHRPIASTIKVILMKVVNCTIYIKPYLLRVMGFLRRIELLARDNEIDCKPTFMNRPTCTKREIFQGLFKSPVIILFPGLRDKLINTLIKFWPLVILLVCSRKLNDGTTIYKLSKTNQVC